MKLICITGAKNSKKHLLAMSLANNSDCIWIKPYTDKKFSRDNPLDDMYIPMNSQQLTHKMEREVPLVVVELEEVRYVFFENQLNADFVVLIGDDRVASYLRNEWDGELITVKCHSDSEEFSERNKMLDKEFDIVFNYDNDDVDDLILEIGGFYDCGE